MAFDVKTFTTRTITAIVFVAVLLSCILFHFISFTLLFLVITIWGLYEFYQLSEHIGAKPYKYLGYTLATIIYIVGVISGSSYVLFTPINAIFGGVLVVLFCSFIIALFDKQPDSIKNITYTITGVVYVALPFMLLNKIACIDKNNLFMLFVDFPEDTINNIINYNSHYVLGIILLIWANDVSAYLVGSFLGKHKLYERISPKKTWEGTIGAALLTIGASFVVSGWFNELDTLQWIVVSLIVSVFGTTGDLIESMLKRQAGVKDSGKIMPGHGGILDRFDSLLFVSPFIYFYLTLIK